MRSEPDSGPIWSTWNLGKAAVGALKPHSRVTVQPNFYLSTVDSAGSRPAAKLPIRWFQDLHNSQQEIEIPGVRNFEVEYDIDQDVATLKVQLVNNRFDRDYGSAEWSNAGGDFGQPGYLTPDRGSRSNRWGFVSNEWAGILTRNALLRCVDTETEILTRRGWLSWHEVEVGDEALGINPDTGRAEWQDIEEVFRRDYRGPLTWMHGRVHDSLTTANHRWLTKTTAGRWSWKTTETLTTDSAIPLSAPVDLPREPTMSDDLVELAAWYFTEGSHDHRQRSLDWGIKISQSEVNPENVERIRLAAKRLFGPPGYLPRGPYVAQERIDRILRLYAEGVGQREIARRLGENRESVRRWVMGIRPVDRSARWCERKLGNGQHEFYFSGPAAEAIKALVVGWHKVPRPEFLTALTREQLELFIEVALLGDGTRDERQEVFIQCHEQRMSAFEMACVLAGRAIHRKAPTRLSLLRQQVVRPVGAAKQAGRFAIEERHYDGVVWCPRVKHGNWLARRSGSVFYTGNTYEGYGGHGKTLAQAIADGNLVLSGVWLVDDTPIQVGQSFELVGRSMAKLLVDQQIFPPLVPAGDYPMQRQRFFYTEVTTPVEIYGHTAANPNLKILGIERPVDNDGYWLTGTDGGVFTYGLAHFWGSIDSIGLSVTPAGYPNLGIASMAPTPDGKGYWLVTDAGAVYAFGDATYHGGLALGASPPHPVIAIETAGTSDGYWLFTDNGGVFSYGAAAFYGSSPPIVAGQRIVDAASTPDGGGYWLVDSAGHVYAYGNAPYEGGLPSAAHPIVAIAPTPSGAGYYLVGSDGGVFAYGDAQFYGSAAAIALNDPMSDIAVSVDGSGYWLVAEDGGVFTYAGTGSQVGFYGSLVGASDIEFSSDGNYLDYCDIIRDLALYAGFYLQDGGASDEVFGVLEQTGVYSPDDSSTAAGLDATFFDKLAVIDPMTKIKEVVGYLLYVDDEGGLHFHEPNFWESGNFLPDMSHTFTVPVIDERVNLSSYSINVPDADLRSQIIISSEIPIPDSNQPGDATPIPGTVTSYYTPATASELRGLIKPAMWVNEVFLDPTDQETMAELIALHIYFKSRLGTVTAMANPLIQINDQVQIIERETFEDNVHYVRRIRRTHDRKTGEYRMEMTTNVLSAPGVWAVVKPDNSPTGTVATNRTSV